ncbi:hypothetical protein B0H17DRAFT_1199629 [Mycena rosella]|uniref:Uncharacterized protein n=1 Tax=Mycena rosella TaxID=1033263 RepID=A0AAD7GLW5_MYCRO|nr:hypothetical protein B0H17DRAFT_1199629 [Mycena rosella]
MLDSWGGINCLQKVDLDIIHQMKAEMGRDELIVFTSVQFAEHAQHVFDLLGPITLTQANIWDVFAAMLPLRHKPPYTMELDAPPKTPSQTSTNGMPKDSVVVLWAEVLMGKPLCTGLHDHPMAATCQGLPPFLLIRDSDLHYPAPSTLFHAKDMVSTPSPPQHESPRRRRPGASSSSFEDGIHTTRHHSGTPAVACTESAAAVLPPPARTSHLKPTP